MTVTIEQIDIFGLGRMWWQGQQLRECLTDHARYDAGDRMEEAIRLPAPGCKHGGLVIDVAQDAAGRWWSGFSWRCYLVGDGASNGTHTPIDAHRGATREEAISRAAAALVASLPTTRAGKAERVFALWRRELAVYTIGDA
jgi:hypothetical protein